MERGRFLKKEPEKPGVIQIEDRWNTPTQRRELLINAEELTRLAVRDFGFTPTDISRTKLVIDSLFDIDLSYNTTIGVEEVHRHADRPASSLGDDLGILNPEIAKEAIPDFLDPGLPVDVLAAHSLREALSLKKAYLVHADSINHARKKGSQAFTGMVAATTAGYFLLKRGEDPAAWFSMGGALGLAYQTGRLREQADKASFDRVQLGNEAHELEIQSSNEDILEEWRRVISFGSTDNA